MSGYDLGRGSSNEQVLSPLLAYTLQYVGLSPPLLGAVNPLRAVISGENMGLPMQDSAAREMELSECGNLVHTVTQRVFS